jgi:MFS family permease
MSSKDAEQKPKSSTRASVLVGIVCALTLLLSVLPREAWVLDDALIYQNYVRSALQGRGLVYGPGTTAEGYSSPLWTVLLCMLGAIGLQGFGVAKIVGTIFGAAASAATGFFAAHRLGWKRGLAISLILALSPAWAWWSASGMETPLLGFLFAVAAIACLTEREMTAAVATGLIGVTRPEGFVFVAILLAYFFLVSAKDAWSTRRTIVVVTLCLLPVLTWAAFRLINYETLIANSAWAKLGAGATEVSKPALRGITYLFESLRRLPGAWLVGLVSTFAVLRGGAAKPSQMLVVALLFFLILFSTFVGGDWMPWVRFIVPGIPLMLILAVAPWNEYQTAARGRFGAMVGVALLLTTAQQYLEFKGYFTHHEVSGHHLQPRWPAFRRPLIDPVTADRGAHFYAAHIARFTEPGDTVIHIDIGQSGYLASDVRIMDTFGLVSRFEAEYLHGKHSAAELGQHFSDLDPSLVFMLMDPSTGQSRMRVTRALTETLASDYASVVHARWWSGQVLLVMVRRDRLGSEPDPQRIERWVADSPGLNFDLSQLGVHQR